MKKIIFVLSFGVLAGATAFGGSFGETGRRTSPSNDIFRRFDEHFTFRWGALSSPIPETCSKVTDDNRAFLGEINAATGKPVFEEASPAFMNWYYGCIKIYIDAERNSPDFKATDGLKYFGADGIALLKPILKNSAGTSVFEKARFWKWFDLPIPLRKIIEQHVLESLIGPGIVDDEEKFKTEVFENVLGNNKDLTVGDALELMIVSAMSQEEFLNF